MSNESDNDSDEDEVVVFPKRKEDDEIDMTPMIDITFLLLIFFVVTSDMNPEKAANLPDAKNGSVIALNNAAIIQVKPGAGDIPEVVLGDGRKLPDDPDAQDVELGDYLRFEFEQGKSLVVLQAEGDVSTGQVGRIRRAISEAMDEEADTIHVAVMERP
jgi:biopolymer transport protein ExbD